MYKWLFRIMPGPAWLRAIELGIVILGVIGALFAWGFPWIVDYFGLTDNTVS